MSRRQKYTRSLYIRDKRMTNYIIQIIVNRMIKKGKKYLSYSILYNILEEIQNKTQRDPKFILEHAVRITMPKVQLKSRRLGGSSYQIPVNVEERKGVAIRIRWILSSSLSRSTTSIKNRVMSEIIDASRGNGRSVRKREEVNRIAEANQAFARFNFLDLYV